jgi:fused signal recognition particle receptor
MVFNWFRRKFTDSPDGSENNEPENNEAVGAETVAAPQTADAPNADYLSWAKTAYQRIQERQGLSGVTSQETEPETQSEPPVPEPQTPEPETVEPAEPSVETIPESEAVLEPTVEPQESSPPVAAIVEDVTQPKSIEPEATDAEEGVSEEDVPVTPESDTTATTESEIVEAAVSEPEITASESSTPESEPLPFWAQTEAEQQQRLAQLQAEATPTPEAEAAPPSPPPEIAPSTIPTPAPEPVLEPAIEPVSAATTIPTNDSLKLDEGFIWSAEVLAAQGRRPEDISPEEISWLQKLRRGLDKTRQGVVNQLKAVVGRGPLDREGVNEIETLLLQADVGVAATDEIIESLQQKLREEVASPTTALNYLKQILREMLDRPYASGNYTNNFAPDKEQLNIWLLTGVNGVGKTTTIGKLAHVATGSGYKCLIGAADTFRAAAVEQVKVWGQRSNVEVVANPGKNTDPAAVVFDAISAAQSRQVELLLVDTAGRLQNKQNLMEELRKIRRIVDKKAPGAKIESLLVLDATLGQNGLRQAQIFAEAAQLSGVIITKLDGSAKGGVALAVVQELGLPIRFIGAGEGIEDLRPFSSYEFVEALLSD